MSEEKKESTALEDFDYALHLLTRSGQRFVKIMDIKNKEVVYSRSLFMNALGVMLARTLVGLSADYRGAIGLRTKMINVFDSVFQSELQKKYPMGIKEEHSKIHSGLEIIK